VHLSASRDRGRFQVRCRHAHAEVDAPASFHRPHDINRDRQVADHNLGAGCAQRCGAFIFAMDHRAHRHTAAAQPLHHHSSDTAHAARGACNKDRALNRHAIVLLILNLCRRSDESSMSGSADTVLYLTEARQVTGEVLHVNGGAHVGNRNPQRLNAGFRYLPVLCADPAAGVSATAASDVSRRKVSVSCRYSVTLASEWFE
jgi:hypothetical protein